MTKAIFLINILRFPRQKKTPNYIILMTYSKTHITLLRKYFTTGIKIAFTIIYEVFTHTLAM